MQPIWSLGLMSGTSADGIDGAIIYTDGQTILEFGPTINLPYDQAFQNRLKSSYGFFEMTPAIQKIEDELTHRHGQVVAFLKARQSQFISAHLSAAGSCFSPDLTPAM